MALPPQKFRELVIQLLYAQELATETNETIVDFLMKELAISKKNVLLAQAKMREIQPHLSLLDQCIEKVAISYDLHRIQIVTKNILRLALFELLYESSLPPKIIIAEAIRLSRKFNSPSSTSFVNAILDRIYQLIKQHAIPENTSKINYVLDLLEKHADSLALQPPLIEEDPEQLNDSSSHAPSV